MPVFHRAAFQHPSHHTCGHLSRAWLCKCSLGTDRPRKSGPSDSNTTRQALLGTTLGNTFLVFLTESVYGGLYVTTFGSLLWSWLMQADWSTVFYMFAELFAIKADSLKIKQKECCGIVLQYSRSQKCCCVVLGYGLTSQMFPFWKWRERSKHHYP